MKNKPEKVIADFHIRMVENENGIRIINTDVFGDLDDFAQISQNLVDTKDYNMRTILLLNSMSEYIKMKLEDRRKK